MLNLIERANQLASNANEISALRAIEKQAKEIVSRTSQFENALAKLRLNVGKARLLQSRDVSVKIIVHSHITRCSLRELRDKVSKDPAAILQVEDIQSKLLKPIENISLEIEKNVGLAWSEHVQQKLPTFSDELLETLAQVPRLRSRVNHVKNLLDQALRQSKRPPADVEEFDRIHELFCKCRQALNELDAIGVPDEVLELLQNAARPEGANLSKLTPTVLDWLTAHKLTDILRIRVR